MYILDFLCYSSDRRNIGKPLSITLVDDKDN